MKRRDRAVHRHPPEPVLPDHNAMLRPGPAKASDMAQFMELLRQFRIWAGNPSYRGMVARDERFTASALHAALNRDVLPAFPNHARGACADLEDSRRNARFVSTHTRPSPLLARLRGLPNAPGSMRAA